MLIQTQPSQKIPKTQVYARLKLVQMDSTLTHLLTLVPLASLVVLLAIVHKAVQLVRPVLFSKVIFVFLVHQDAVHALVVLFALLALILLRQLW